VTQTAQALLADASLRSIESEIERRHSESVGRLQEWVKRPALAAEDRGMDEGCDLMMRMARDDPAMRSSVRAAAPSPSTCAARRRASSCRSRWGWLSSRPEPRSSSPC